MTTFRRIPVNVSPPARGVEVRDDKGTLVGSVMPLTVPGVRSPEPLEPYTVYIGWARDWDAPAEEGYVPLDLGVSEDPETHYQAIEDRALRAQQQYES